MKSYVLHLIRHGFTSANKDGRYIGCKTDEALTAESKKQLKIMKEDYVYPSVSAVYSSPMLRCTETAKILYPHREVTAVENLREYDFGDFENKTAAALDGRPDYAAWCAGQLPAPPNGESSKDFTARIVLGINEILLNMMENEIFDAAVIMHGGAIMMLLAACGLPQRRMVEWTSENGGGYTIRITPSLYQKTGAFEVTGILPEDGCE